MKAKVFILCLSAHAEVALAQGVVGFANTLATPVRTNAVGLGGALGNTLPSTSGSLFYFGVFTAPSSLTSISPSGQELLSTAWTFTGAFATNTAATAGGRLTGGSDAVVPTGWPAGATNSFVVVGWSANISGPNWDAVAAQFAGASLTNGVWTGPNWIPSNQGEFFGISAVGDGVACSLPCDPFGPFNLFGTLASAGRHPVGGFDLFVVNTPEPSTWALAACGFAMLLAVRRRDGRLLRIPIASRKN